LPQGRVQRFLQGCAAPGHEGARAGFGVYPYEKWLFLAPLPSYTATTRFKETKRLMAYPHQKKQKKDDKKGGCVPPFLCFVVMRFPALPYMESKCHARFCCALA